MQKAQMPNQGMPGNNVENPVTEVLGAVASLNIPLIIGCFLFYYLGGYLLYSALFGAVGAAVDNDADTQQFMLPITLPIIFSFVFAQFVLRDPDGTLAFWTSIIPFTSPIIMMVRIPFGVPAWELALSMVLLILGFMLPVIALDLHLSSAQAGSLVTWTLSGAVLGGIVFGVLSDWFGRVRMLTWTILIFAVFTGLCALARGYADLLAYRTIAGIGLGGEFGIGMTLVAEVILWDYAISRPYILVPIMVIAYT